MDRKENLYLLLDLDPNEIYSVEDLDAKLEQKANECKNGSWTSESGELQKVLSQLEKLKQVVRDPQQKKQHAEIAKRILTDDEDVTWIATNVQPTEKILANLNLCSLYNFLSENPANIKGNVPTYKTSDKISSLMNRISVLSEKYDTANQSEKQDLIRKCNVIFENETNKRRYDEYIEQRVKNEVKKDLDTAARLSKKNTILDDQFKNLISHHTENGYTKSGFDAESIRKAAKEYCDQQGFYIIKPEGDKPKSEVWGGSAGIKVTPPPTRIRAGLLGIFFGSFGAHNFYLGKKKYGFAQLLCSIICAIIGNYLVGIGILWGSLLVFGMFWGYIEGVFILAGKRWYYFKNGRHYFEPRGSWQIIAFVIHLCFMALMFVIIQYGTDIFGGLL